jgi:hypothetical protein
MALAEGLREPLIGDRNRPVSLSDPCPRFLSCRDDARIEEERRRTINWSLESSFDKGNSGLYEQTANFCRSFSGIVA